MDPAQPEELRDAMISLRNDPAFEETLRLEGYRRALTLLDPHSLTEQWLKLYQDLIG